MTKQRTVGLLIIKLLISFGLMIFVIQRLPVIDFGKVIQTIAVVPVLLVVLLALLQVPIQAVRWNAAIGAFAVRLGIVDAMRIVYISHFFNQVLPSSVGGDAIRAVMGKKYLGSLTASAASVFLERMATLVVMALFALPGVLIFQSRLEIGYPPAEALVAMLLATILLISAALVFRKKISSLLKWLVVKLGVGKSRGKRLAWGMLATTVIAAYGHFVFFVMIYLLCRAVDGQVSLTQILVVTPFVLLISALPISISGWGVRESGMVWGLGLYGIPAELAFIVSVVFGGILAVTTIPAIFLLIFKSTDKPKDVQSHVPAKQRDLKSGPLDCVL